ncbi:MAG TPA: lysophospholipid acyltransferase family protein [Thermoanaerobaculia bacterium]|nr:lysophospholipid acyltransferase family protein [Thermoanaerobaculia bacterium]
MKLLSLVAFLFLKTLNRTLRVRHVDAQHIDATPRYIIAFWHECILGAMHSRWRKPTTAMISRSKDGEIVTGVVHRYGIDTARGSSNRGGSGALREILRDVKDGKNIAFTPDGPKGPRREVKDGVVYAAKMTGLPVVPFHFTAKAKKRLRSWDQMIVPRPFSEAVFVYGPPIAVPRDGDVEEWRLKIEQQMNDLADRAEVEVSR